MKSQAVDTLQSVYMSISKTLECFQLKPNISYDNSYIASPLSNRILGDGEAMDKPVASAVASAKQSAAADIKNNISNIASPAYHSGQCDSCASTFLKSEA